MMAKYTGPSLGQALDRWRKPHIRSIDTDIEVSNGLRGGEMTVTSMTGQVRLVLTGVTAEPGANQLDEVHRSFDQLIHAPSDAALLAAEVERLQAKVEALTLASEDLPAGPL